jgi:hypothetical protein
MVRGAVRGPAEATVSVVLAWIPSWVSSADIASSYLLGAGRFSGPQPQARPRSQVRGRGRFAPLAAGLWRGGITHAAACRAAAPARQAA